jgi:hypothetical protein
MSIDQRLMDSAPRLRNTADGFAPTNPVVSTPRRPGRRNATFAGFAVVMAAVIAVVLIAVGTTSGSRKRAKTPPAPKQYAVDATVLQRSPNPPELCVGGVLTSRPPQCSGATIVGLDWATVPGAETVAGVTWGEYHVVGTYDDASYTFTLTQPLTSATQHPQPVSAHKFDAPCSAPPGGWGIVNKSKVTLADYQAMTATVPTEPGYAGMWLDSSTPVDGRVVPLTNQVITFAFTGNLAEHRSQIAAMWGGPICVIQHTRSRAQLDSIAQRVQGPISSELGLRVVSGAVVDDVANTVTIDVMIAPPGAQHELDKRVGVGVVRLHQVLTPAEDAVVTPEPIVTTTGPPIPAHTGGAPTKAEVRKAYNAALDCIRSAGVVITSSNLTMTSNDVQVQSALDYLKSSKTADEVSAIDGRCRAKLISISGAWHAAAARRPRR